MKIYLKFIAVFVILVLVPVFVILAYSSSKQSTSAPDTTDPVATAQNVQFQYLLNQPETIVSGSGFGLLTGYSSETIIVTPIWRKLMSDGTYSVLILLEYTAVDVTGDRKEDVSLIVGCYSHDAFKVRDTLYTNNSDVPDSDKVLHPAKKDAIYLSDKGDKVLPKVYAVACELSQ